MLSFCAVLLGASTAMASVYLQCEAEPVMSVAPEQRSEEPWSELADDDDRADCDGLVIERSGQVPICLLEGASAVADRPVHEVDGVAIEAADGTCIAFPGADEVTAPSEDKPFEAPQSVYAAVEPISLDVPQMPPPVLAEMLAPRLWSAPPGHTGRVFRPPRS